MLKFHTANLKSRHLTVPCIIHIQFQSPKAMSFTSILMLSYHLLLQLLSMPNFSFLYLTLPTWPPPSHNKLIYFTNLTILGDFYKLRHSWQCKVFNFTTISHWLGPNTFKIYLFSSTDNVPFFIKVTNKIQYNHKLKKPYSHKCTIFLPRKKWTFWN
jgi:hypothetical protein